jgi:hypothetical protein
MRSAGAASAALVCVLVGCSAGGVQVAKGAVRQAGKTVGNDSISALELTSQDVSRLAAEAGVGDDVIRDTAQELDNQSLWASSMGNLRSMYEQTPGEVRSNLVGIACDGVRGEITPTSRRRQC